MRSIIVFLLIISLSISLIPSYGQTQNVLIVSTSDKTYDEGGVVVISGKVSPIITDTPVTIQVFKEGNLVEIAQLNPAKDGTFTHSIIAQGPLWKSSGEYLVRASYGPGNVSETSFQFFTKQSSPEISETFEVDAGSSGTFDVKYIIRGGTLKNILVDSDIFGLVVIIDSNGNGSITLELPREFIDAKKQDGSDDTYIILIDGIEVPYQEPTKDSTSRTIKIEFDEGDSDIEIIGTFVVPEFGFMATLILATALISGIVLYRRNHFSNIIKIN